MDASAMSGLPPLNLSSGPAMSEGASSGSASSSSGDFFFGPQQPSTADRLWALAPMLIIAAGIYWALRR